MEESQQGTYLQVGLQRMYKNIHKHSAVRKTRWNMYTSMPIVYYFKMPLQ